jgi:phosphatidate cytidylyltransferase
MSIASSELVKRIIFGVLLGGAALFCVLWNAFAFHAMVLVGALLAYAEWLDLTQDEPKVLQKFGGLAYIGLPVWSLVVLRGTGSADLILALFSMVWATDIAAYFGGKAFGRHKLWPAISPSKTWEGLGCGIVAAGAAGIISSLFVPFPSTFHGGFAVGAAIAIVAQAGDLFESWIKRRAGAKDSSNLIPGHGGVLDRVDGLMFAAPVFTALVVLNV